MAETPEKRHELEVASELERKAARMLRAEDALIKATEHFDKASARLVAAQNAINQQ